jgi:microcompartment protein CcmL/EutN
LNLEEINLKKNLILLEFKNISSAFFILNEITKNFNVNVEESRLICPGKYLLIFSGTQGDIDSVRMNVEEIKSENSKYKHIIIKTVSGISGDLLIKLNKIILYPEYVRSLGIVEFSNTAGAIEAADFIEDMSPVVILTIKIGIGMCAKGVILFEGDTSAVTDIITKVENENLEGMISSDIVNSPSKILLDNFRF